VPEQTGRPALAAARAGGPLELVFYEFVRLEMEIMQYLKRLRFSKRFRHDRSFVQVGKMSRHRVFQTTETCKVLNQFDATGSLFDLKL